MSTQAIATLVDDLLEALATKLGPLSPFTKAVVPAALGVATAAVTVVVALITGSSVDPIPLCGAGALLIGALLTFFVHNKPKVAPVPPKPVVPAPKA